MCILNLAQGFQQNIGLFDFLVFLAILSVTILSLL